ncbi:MAG: imidazole glycerol phosphate synthase subunit HisF [Methanobacteriota archaeon]
MLKRRIVPCLDVHEGRVVKGVKFRNLRRVGDPPALASRYEKEGADEVVFLDISASRQGRKTFLGTVRRTAEQLFVPLTVGGGISSEDDVQKALDAGADKVSINTAAVRDPMLVKRASKRFGAQCVVVAIDAKRVEGRREKVDGAGSPTPRPSTFRLRPRWEVYTHGGTKPTGLDAVKWAARVARLGAGEILLTSMDRDGTTDGYDVALTRAVADASGLPIVASGGAGELSHFAEVLTKGHADAALAASVFHYRTLSVGRVKAYLSRKKIPVRR